MKSDAKHPLWEKTDEVVRTLVRLGYDATQGKRMLANRVVVRRVRDDKQGSKIREVIKRESGMHVYLDTRVCGMYVYSIEESHRSSEDEAEPVASERDNRLEDYNGEYGLIPAHNPDRAAEDELPDA